MKVHRELGSGFQEYIYQRALEIELKKLAIKFIREYEIRFIIREKKLE